MPEGEEILTTGEACRLLKIGKKDIYRLVRQERLRCYRIGTARNSPLRYRRSDLLVLLRRHRLPEVSGGE